MASSYKGLDLFGSGPHRFSQGLAGLAIEPRWRVTGVSTDTGTLPLGDLEPEVVVTGRLVASTEAGLWTLRRAIADLAVLSAGAGVLVDLAGHSYADMWLIEYAEADRVDSGRVWSVGYVARFRDFETL